MVKHEEKQEEIIIIQKQHCKLLKFLGLSRHRDLPTQNYPTRSPAQKQMTNHHDRTKK